MAKRNRSFSMDVINKLKPNLQKKSEDEERQAELEEKLDPIGELDPTNKLDFGILDWGKCSFLKPCVKRMNAPCGCVAYFSIAFTLVAGMIGSIIIW